MKKLCDGCFLGDQKDVSGRSENDMSSHTTNIWKLTQGAFHPSASRKRQTIESFRVLTHRFVTKWSFSRTIQVRHIERFSTVMELLIS